MRRRRRKRWRISWAAVFIIVLPIYGRTDTPSYRVNSSGLKLSSCTGSGKNQYTKVRVYADANPRARRHARAHPLASRHAHTHAHSGKRVNTHVRATHMHIHPHAHTPTRAHTHMRSHPGARTPTREHTRARTPTRTYAQAHPLTHISYTA